MSWPSLLYYSNLYYTLGYTEYLSRKSYPYQARTEYYAENYNLAIWYVIQGQIGLFDIVKYLLGYATNWNDYSYLTPEMFKRLQPPEPTAVSMSSIIMAMYEATPQELTSFIGLVDAFRQTIWNKPFPKEYFAEIARGFSG